MILTPELLLGIQRRLEHMREPVQGIVFYSTTQGDHGQHMLMLAQELQPLSPKLTFQIYPIEQHADKVKFYGIDKAPALILENKLGQQTRFFGLPAGAAFHVFLSDILALSSGRSDLPHDLAMLNPHIQADMIRIEEFRAMADKYNSMGVPQTIGNGRFAINGNIPSNVFVKKVKESGTNPP